MGEQKVSLLSEKKQRHKFIKNLLRDVMALEYMIENDWFETDVTRIGAEQEMCLVKKKNYKPAPIAAEVLEKMKKYEWVESELARFNLEVNLTPQVFEGACLSKLEKQILEQLTIIQKHLDPFKAELVLAGIVPTIQKFDLSMDNLMPKKRYKALMDAINQQQRGNGYNLKILGIDELIVKHDSPLLEAANTSFQVHLQVTPDSFANMHNISQAIVAPVLSMAANSPMAYGRRLWHETRIALFQQALDTRGSHDHLRERSPRVSFGNDWLDKSILEIYKEDIARFRVLISGDVEEDSFDLIHQNITPKLRSLQVHNSTVYRWNRPCYGVSPNGKPHLRIENRVLPSGPTVIDEMANAAFWLGLMHQLGNENIDIRKVMSFDDARDNFGKSARFGMDTKFTWFNNKKYAVIDLVKNELLPRAVEGLRLAKIKDEDITRYLDVIEGRADTHTNGARWQLRSYSNLMKTTTRDESLSILTANIVKNQSSNKPVHEWDLASDKMLKDYAPGKLRVEQLMNTDLFTVQPDDIIEMVADIMDWQKIRYAPVEDEKGDFVGLVSSRLLIRHFAKQVKGNLDKKVSSQVEDIMLRTPITIKPETTLVEALRIMKKHKIGCLPVVKGQDLMGMMTDRDFLRISGRLINRLAEEEED